jgi:phosphomethylpyrimidine synthase
MTSRCTIGNKIRKRPVFQCGDGHPTLVIGSVGTSQKSDSLATEIEKTKRAVALGAHAVTDHSFYGDIIEYHRGLIDNVDAYISTVANYELAARCRDDGTGFRGVNDHLPIDILREQVERGMDIITIHASFLQRHLVSVSTSKRLIPTTSKGGGIISSWMRSRGEENPYYTYYDEILDMFKEYNTTISLGTVFRPATVCDSWDDVLIEELTVMGELVQRAYDKGVPIMIEGLGHSTMGNMQAHITIAKTLCHGAAYRMLPMATDIALGYDHISAAIAAAVGVQCGVNAVLCVSRAEHIGLPREEDLEEAIIATRIGVHCGEISLPNADLSKDRQMSITRWKEGCKGDWSWAIHPEGAKQALERYDRLDDQIIQCSMCGSYCGIAAGISTAKHGAKASLQVLAAANG